MQGHFADFNGRITDQKNDFKKFILKQSNGITSTGLILLNQSLEAYIYAILGSQSKTRQNIVGFRASALETQIVFRKLVEDAIVNYNVSTWIQNMNLAVSDTNVILDTAISPSLWLIPSNMIIQKTIIPGYNNMLKIASKNMKFGLNKNINYMETHKSSQKKTHQSASEASTHHLDSFPDNLETEKNKNDIIDKIPKRQEKTEKNNKHNTNLITTMIFSGIITYLVIKYIQTTIK